MSCSESRGAVYEHHHLTKSRRIESNLDALTITPRMHRQQMLRYVHRPALYRLEYRQIQPADLCKSSQPLIYLKATCEDDAGLGPIAFFAVPKPGQWLPIDSRPRSDVQTQILKFFVKAAYICGELGSWAATHFILETIAALRAQEQLKGDLLTKSTDVAALLGLLDRGPLRSMFERWYPEDTFHVSPKVECFLSFLSKHTSDDCSGIVFVQQRVTAAVLCKLLSIHPSTRDRFRCATFVGMANNTAKKYHIAELLDLKAQRETLPGFRARRKNLIIATDALEEGIDVSACNLVLCFSPPTNLKSFIQRRGRARQEKSQFAIMLAADEKSTKIDSWRSLEKSLIEAYQSDMRKVEDLKKVEAEEEAVLGELRSSK